MFVLFGVDPFPVCPRDLGVARRRRQGSLQLPPEPRCEDLKIPRWSVLNSLDPTQGRGQTSNDRRSRNNVYPCVRQKVEVT